MQNLFNLFSPSKKKPKNRKGVFGETFTICLENYQELNFDEDKLAQNKTKQNAFIFINNKIRKKGGWGG